MSNTKAVTIWCDGTHNGHACGEWHEEQVDQINRARLLGLRRGWVNAGTRDYCPSHSRDHDTKD